VAPWRSVYKIALLADTDVTFLLTSGGHNAGIVSEPGHPRREHRVGSRREGEPYVAPDDWRKVTPVREGSWWPSWQAWLVEHSGEQVEPRPVGNDEAGYASLGDAPGSYVLLRDDVRGFGEPPTLPEGEHDHLIN
jgi:polyhydroxyalkanoate synthase